MGGIHTASWLLQVVGQVVAPSQRKVSAVFVWYWRGRRCRRRRCVHTLATVGAGCVAAVAVHEYAVVQEEETEQLRPVGRVVRHDVALQ